MGSGSARGDCTEQFLGAVRSILPWTIRFQSADDDECSLTLKISVAMAADCFVACPILSLLPKKRIVALIR